ncbi:MAG TPA: hypothetical protein VFX49_18725 [Chloroflexota bacterium]|nr:hypothetical protein [Chloroflexota bacterium]
MAGSPPVFCARCKIGTLDADGLCVLCGTPGVPPSPARRALASALSAATSVPAFALVACALLLAAIVVVGRYSAPSPSFASRLALLNPLTVPLAARSTPHGTLVAVVGPLIGQAIIVFVILLIVFWLTRRRRGARPGAAETT